MKNTKKLLALKAAASQAFQDFNKAAVGIARDNAWNKYVELRERALRATAKANGYEYKTIAQEVEEANFHNRAKKEEEQERKKRMVLRYSKDNNLLQGKASWPKLQQA